MLRLVLRTQPRSYREVWEKIFNNRAGLTNNNLDYEIIEEKFSRRKQTR